MSTPGPFAVLANVALVAPEKVALGATVRMLARLHPLWDP